ncbi:T9SS type A sorting domain-containing protein [Neolewinella persica]|uniref:T9SS type A sorting domain-containing protein n=1 Tax=Neolewinella persica TaxID=70998 RepID=UPI00035F57E5|nr:T9SS type A sorting domain-containing protein [Neolewinella persica]
MKQFVLLFCLSVSLSLSAQSLSGSFPQNQTKAAVSNEQLTSMVNLPVNSDWNKSAVLDTVFAPALSLACAAAPTVFISDNSGFVTGTNGYFDLEKLQRIELPEATNFSINSALVAFIMPDSTFISGALDNQKIVVNVYDDLNADGSFGDFLGASDTILVVDLGLDTSGFFFSDIVFSTPVELTDASAFILGIDFSDMYRSEEGGDLGIVTTNDGCGDGNNVLEFFFNDMGGVSFNTVNANWGGLDIEMLVGATIDRDPFTSVRTPTTDFSASAFPNPADDQLSILFQAPVAGSYVIRLLSPNGQVIRSQGAEAVVGNAEVAIPVADLPAGVYLFQVQGTTGVQTGRVVIK